MLCEDKALHPLTKVLDPIEINSHVSNRHKAMACKEIKDAPAALIKFH